MSNDPTVPRTPRLRVVPRPEDLHLPPVGRKWERWYHVFDWEPLIWIICGGVAFWCIFALAWMWVMLKIACRGLV